MLEVKNVNYKYSSQEKQRIIFENLSLKFEQGKFYVILGESGSGKTTFLNIIGGQDARYEGEILLNNKSIKEIGFDQYKSAHVGFIFQDYNLLMNYSAVENILIAIDIAKTKKGKDEIYRLLESFGISKEAADRKASTLSGGEQQRVAIARAIARDNEIIIADEPTGNLDVKTGNEILKILKNTVKENGKCLIMVTHNPEIAKEADYVFRMNQQEYTMEESDMV